MTRIGIILGSTRPNRNGEQVAKWVYDIASRRSDAGFELVEELIAAVGDEGGEVGTVRQFEGQHRRGVVGAQALQLGHRPTLLRSCTTAS